MPWPERQTFPLRLTLGHISSTCLVLGSNSADKGGEQKPGLLSELHWSFFHCWPPSQPMCYSLFPCLESLVSHSVACSEFSVILRRKHELQRIPSCQELEVPAFKAFCCEIILGLETCCKEQRVLVQSHPLPICPSILCNRGILIQIRCEHRLNYIDWTPALICVSLMFPLICFCLFQDST